MSSSSQFIGLNAAAYEFLRRKNCKRELSGFYAVGIGNEEIPLYKYTSQTNQVYLEVIDVEFSSGGPVVLTCLIEEGSREKICSWEEDTNLPCNEYIDSEKGIFHT